MQSTRVELHFDRGSCFVKEVYVNGAGPFCFILSTDTTKTSMDKELAAKLGLEVEEAGKGFGLGGEVTVKRAKLKSLKLGGSR